MGTNKNNTPTPHGNRKGEDTFAVENNKGKIGNNKSLESNNGRGNDQVSPSLHGSTCTVVTRKGKSSTDVPLKMNEGHTNYTQNMKKHVVRQETKNAVLIHVEDSNTH
eukprot:4149445-Ditylum_brightwellii.AAC.1